MFSCDRNACCRIRNLIEGEARDTREMLQEALMGMIGKPTKKLVHVDFAEKLAEIGLAKYFPHEVQESLVVPRIA